MSSTPFTLMSFLVSTVYWLMDAIDLFLARLLCSHHYYTVFQFSLCTSIWHSSFNSSPLSTCFFSSRRSPESSSSFPFSCLSSSLHSSAWKLAGTTLAVNVCKERSSSWLHPVSAHDPECTEIKSILNRGRILQN